MYRANEFEERSRRQNRETVPDLIPARMPASSGTRRISEGRLDSRPSSKHGERSPSSRSLDSEITQKPHQFVQMSQKMPLSYQRPHQGAGNVLPHQSSEELVSLHGLSFVPKPPSRQGRPKSVKGWARPSSRVGRENVGSREGSTHAGDQGSFPPSLKPQLSFSKYKPLPSIGIGVVPDAENHDISKTDSGLETTAGLSLQHTLPDEPADSEPGRVQLAIKMLDGSRHERWFRHTDTLAAVITFAASLSNNLPPPCQLCTNEVPRRVFDNLSLSLSQAGIDSRTLLYLEEKIE